MPDIEKGQGALPGKRNVSDQTSISRSSCGLSELCFLLLASRHERNGRRLPPPAGFLGMVCDSACVKQTRSAAQRSRLRSTHHSSRYFHPTLPPSERKPAAYNRTERPSGQESPRTSQHRSTSSLRKAIRPAGTASKGIAVANGAALVFSPFRFLRAFPPKAQSGPTGCRTVFGFQRQGDCTRSSGA